MAIEAIERLGVYKTPDQVPPHHKLENCREELPSERPWEAYRETTVGSWITSERSIEELDRARRKWEQVCSSQGVHPALGGCSVVDEWMHQSLERMNTKTAYNSYWVKLERFYTWMLKRLDYPHRYHPFWMAAAIDLPHAARVWEEKLRRGNEEYE